VKLTKRTIDTDFFSFTPAIDHASQFGKTGRIYRTKDNGFFIYERFRIDFEVKNNGESGMVKIFRSSTLGPYQQLKEKLIIQFGNYFRENSQPLNSAHIIQNRSRRYKKDEYDTGNIRAVVSFREGVEGGVLVFPEYDIMFPMINHSILLYKSAGLYSGVTPARDKRTLITFFSAHGKRTKDDKTGGNNHPGKGAFLVR